MTIQTVYVVTDIENEIVVGVFNDFNEAAEVATIWDERRHVETTLTPVLVDTSVGTPMCHNEDEFNECLEEVYECAHRAELENIEEG